MLVPKPRSKWFLGIFNVYKLVQVWFRHVRYDDMIRRVWVRTCRLNTLIKTNTRPPSQATNVACRVSVENDELCILASFFRTNNEKFRVRKLKSNKIRGHVAEQFAGVRYSSQSYEDKIKSWASSAQRWWFTESEERGWQSVGTEMRWTAMDSCHNQFNAGLLWRAAHNRKLFV